MERPLGRYNGRHMDAIRVDIVYRPLRIGWAI